MFIIAIAGGALLGIVVDAVRNKPKYAAEMGRRIKHYGKNWQ